MSPRHESTPQDEITRAIAASNLRELPERSIERLTAAAQRLAIPAGSTIHRAGEDEPHVEIVLRGLVRVQVTAPDGRTLTIRYCRSGALIGVATLYAPGYVRPFSIQAISDAEVLALRPTAVRRCADADAQVAAALLKETSERVFAFVSEISDTAFASVRRRVARHLLDLASDSQLGPTLVAEITQQELAEAVGTVREVVVRTLRDLRDRGIIETGRGRIQVRDPERLLTVD